MWQFTVNMQNCTYFIETLYYFNICWKYIDRSFSKIFIALEMNFFFTVTIVTGGIQNADRRLCLHLTALQTVSVYMYLFPQRSHYLLLFSLNAVAKPQSSEHFSPHFLFLVFVFKLLCPHTLPLFFVLFLSLQSPEDSHSPDHQEGYSPFGSQPCPLSRWRGTGWVSGAAYPQRIWCQCLLRRTHFGELWGPQEEPTILCCFQQWHNLCWDVTCSWSQNWSRSITMYPSGYTSREVWAGSTAAVLWSRGQLLL